MKRSITLKNTDTGQTLTLPVTPSSYPMGAGRAVERLDMAQTGQIALPGLKSLFSGTLEFFLPARSYPFLTAESVTRPQYYIDLLTAWSRDANVCRYIVAGTEVNLPVLLGPLEWEEKDGTNDVYCKLPLYQYRYLEETTVRTLTQNTGRSSEAASQPKTADQYTVQRGDCLWTICRRFYGDGSLAYKLATANGIKNPNLLYPGQVLTLPTLEELKGYKPTPAPSSVPVTQEAKEAKETAEHHMIASVRNRSLTDMSETKADVRSMLFLSNKPNAQKSGSGGGKVENKDWFYASL